MEVQERFRRHDLSRAAGGGYSNTRNTPRDSADGSTGASADCTADKRAYSGCADRIRGGVPTFAVRVRGKGIGRDGVVLPTQGERGHLKRKAGLAPQGTGLLDADNVTLDDCSARNDEVLTFKDVLRERGLEVFAPSECVAIQRLGGADAEESAGPNGDGGGGEIRRDVGSVLSRIRLRRIRLWRVSGAAEGPP